ncbi:hypothetical protein QUF70_13235 [Desulfobacterales bacterium HSG17]|nr:hypothetical protein [Desulfobacterales bacterium HSG17]
MEKESLPEIENQVSNILNTKGKKFLSVNQIRNFLSVKYLKQIKLTKKSSSSETLKALTPYLGKSLRTFKGPRSVSIGFDIPIENIISEFIEINPGISTKQLGNKLPLLKKEYIPVLNILIRKGIVCCIVNDLHKPKLELFQDKKEMLQKQSIADENKAIDKPLAFKAAYDEIGKGRNFVRIHRIREYLGWPDLEFNKVLEKLMADYIIELHGGDPSSLTEEQINNSYTDKKGFYILL